MPGAAALRSTLAQRPGILAARVSLLGPGAISILPS
jgi:hypothetical protein